MLPSAPPPATEAARHDTVFLRRAWWSLLWLLPVPVLADVSGLDLWLERFYFDSGLHDFPWRHVGWFNVLLHDGLRSLLIFLVTGVSGLLLVSRLAPAYLSPYLVSHWLRPRVLAYLLLAMLAGPLLIAVLKEVSVQPCPWSLSMFGGDLPYAGLRAGHVFDWQAPGKCFPASHASGGFALLAFVPMLAGRQRGLMLSTALLLGMIMGWTRMMQGAHFLSHNLWSAWICWAVTLLCFTVMRPLAADATASGDTG